MNPSTDAMPTGYLLTKIAQATTLRFADALEPLGIRPKHYGMLAVAASTPLASQQALAQALGVVPSAIVAMVDHLEQLGALRRTQRGGNRRQFGIEITEAGRRLLAEASSRGAAVDAGMLADLVPAERRKLHSLLVTVATGVLFPPAP